MTWSSNLKNSRESLPGTPPCASASPSNTNAITKDTKTTCKTPSAVFKHGPARLRQNGSLSSSGSLSQRVPYLTDPGLFARFEERRVNALAQGKPRASDRARTRPLGGDEGNGFR